MEDIVYALLEKVSSARLFWVMRLVGGTRVNDKEFACLILE